MTASIRKPAPEITPETLITVRRQWNDWVKGAVKLKDLADFHWRNSSGGVGANSPRAMLYGRMWCTALASGSLAHSCRHGPPPHEILVCIVQKDNDRRLFQHLRSLARD